MTNYAPIFIIGYKNSLTEEIRKQFQETITPNLNNPFAFTEYSNVYVIDSNIKTKYDNQHTFTNLSSLINFMPEFNISKFVALDLSLSPSQIKKNIKEYENHNINAVICTRIDSIGGLNTIQEISRNSNIGIVYSNPTSTNASNLLQSANFINNKKGIYNYAAGEWRNLITNEITKLQK